MSRRRKGKAGSVDRRGSTDALAAPSATAGASGHGEPADPAGPKKAPAKGVPRCDFPDNWLPEDGLSFAKALHQEADLVNIAKDLLGSGDEKMKQRVLEQVLDLAYGKNGRAPAEPIKVITYENCLPAPILTREQELARIGIQEVPREDGAGNSTEQR